MMRSRVLYSAAVVGKLEYLKYKIQNSICKMHLIKYQILTTYYSTVGYALQYMYKCKNVNKYGTCVYNPNSQPLALGVSCFQIFLSYTLAFCQNHYHK